MEVNFAPEIQAEFDRLIRETGDKPNEVIQDAVAIYLAEIAEKRDLLDSRYDDLKSGRVTGIPAQEVLAHFRKKEAARRLK